MSTLTLAPLQTLRHCGLNNATLHDYHYEVFFSVNFWWGTSGETSLRAERTLTTRKHIDLTNHITVAGWESRNCLSPAHLCQYNTFQRTSTSKNSTFFFINSMILNLKIRGWTLFRWVVHPPKIIHSSWIRVNQMIHWKDPTQTSKPFMIWTLLLLALDFLRTTKS